MSAVDVVVGAIWAQTPDGVIGVDGGLPWHLSEDLKFFARTTIGHPVVMGRRTWDSFPERVRPLPGRQNIVITSRPESVPADGERVWAVGSYAEAVAVALDVLAAEPAAGPETEPREIWVLGGPGVWREAAAHTPLPLTRVLVTTVDLDVTGDTYAPALDDAWSRREVADWTVAGNGTRYRIDDHTLDPGTGQAPGPRVVRSGDGTRYELWLEGQQLGFLSGEVLADGTVDLQHTVVFPAFGGRGHARTLVSRVLDGYRERGVKVRASCSYVRDFVDRFPAYRNLLATTPDPRTRG
ncbi:dihydrofolate reductase [Kocuria sp.]|uniref:dihydrofolate reductase n=1 Tax=Kocuria sp. TaxID=1871328 RepID=UPI0026DB8AE0|nr:dihydrofolate reductase [Kocuria sp.]MDO4920157.1 dihydrofolate reductase [Kocuria sp.]